MRKKVFTTILLVAALVSAASLVDSAYQRRQIDKKYAEFETMQVSALTDQAEEIQKTPAMVPVDATPETIDTATSNSEVNTVKNNKTSMIPDGAVGVMHLECVGTFPIMQSNDNSYYLNHDYKGNSDKNGSVFMDCNTSIEDPYCIVYGHNMTNTKTMFNGLYDVVLGDVLTIQTEQGPRSYECVAKYETTIADSAFMIGWDWNNNFLSFVNQAISASNGIELDSIEGKHVVSLVTCDRSYAGKDGRLVTLFVETCY